MEAPKAPSYNQLRADTAAFVANWRNEPGEERQQAQDFVRELLEAFGVSKRRAAVYEKRAKRSSTGNIGYIDALVPGQVAIEMKSAGKNLEAAEKQALDYLDDLNDIEMPRWILTSDFKTFRLTDLLGTGPITFDLEELPAHVEDLQFLAGYQPRTYGDRAQEQASIQAAQIMAGLYELLEAGGYPDHDAGIFLVRILFALYADDSGIWERDLFMRFIEERTNKDGTDLGPQIAMLFQALNTPLKARQTTYDELLARFPYVNGGIFGESVRIANFNKEMRDRLLEACTFNWSTISPAIFGSLFQAVKDPKARRKLGEHYTTETNILKTISPLFLDSLQDRYQRNYNSIPGLKRMRRELGDMHFLDPACGCGNFLVVTYREMRALDLRILTRLQDLGDTSEIPTLFFTEENLPVTLTSFAGIEIEEWPARIAQTALHLVDHQANQQMALALGKAPEPLPLDKITTIHIGNALRMEWRHIFNPSPNVYIMGNPPFIGHETRSREQALDLREIWGRQDIGRLDYVSAWYRKAADFFQTEVAGQFAFVSTNSVTQGEPVPALFQPLFKDGWRIFFAHQTFAWSSEASGAAAVHVVIIGMEKGLATPARLFTYPDIKADPIEVPAKQINPYLVDGPVVFVAQRRRALGSLPNTTFGNMPRDGGNLIIEANEYVAVMADPIAAKYVRPFKMGRELIHNEPRWCLWLVDLDPQDVPRSPVLKARLEEVERVRKTSRAASTRAMAATPHLFGQRSQPAVPYVGIPAVFSENRRFATVQHFPASTIAGNKIYTAIDPDGFLFAIISSSMFITWQKTIGGRLESRPSFSNTIVWNNLPLPAVPEKLRAQIIEAGQGVLEARALHPERSLADHYNPLAMDPALIAAHNRLDRVVDKAFGATKALATNEERQVILFKRYQELTE